MNPRHQPDPFVHGRFQDDDSASEWDSYYLELDILGRYFLAHFSQTQMMYNDWPKLTRALKQMSRDQFFEFCGDIAEEISRRNNDLRDGMAFLPSYDNVSLGRNHMRQKLASIPSRRFHELCMRICFEIGRRSPRRTKRVLQRSFSQSNDPISKVVSAASLEQARLLDNYHRPIYEFSSFQNLPVLLGNLHDDLWSPDESHFLPSIHRDRFDTTVLTIYSLFVSILRDPVRYEALLQSRGDEAQQVLDILQMLLDCPKADATSKRSLLVALTRLSGKSGLHPRCFNLTGIVSGESPVCSGAFGDIWRGDFKGQPVCLKILKLYKSTNREEWLKVFAREAMLWSHTSHPNLLPFYGIFHLDKVHGRICLVSPWMSRGNINEYLTHVPTACRSLLTKDIAAGLSYLHERGIVHGDIKGANILVTDGGRACISDFGSSTIQDAFHTQKGSASLSGTVRWQAPELLSPEVEYPRASFESDVYAYACVLYEIYTGQVPFYEYARDVTVILQIIQGKQPTQPPLNSPPFREWGLTEPKWLIMQRCWERDPRKRPRMGAVLEHIADADADPGSVDGRPRDDWEDRLGSQFRNSVYSNNRLSMGVLETVLSWM